MASASSNVTEADHGLAPTAVAQCTYSVGTPNANRRECGRPVASTTRNGLRVTSRPPVSNEPMRYGRHCPARTMARSYGFASLPKSAKPGPLMGSSVIMTHLRIVRPRAREVFQERPNRPGHAVHRGDGGAHRADRAHVAVLRTGRPARPGRPPPLPARGSGQARLPDPPARHRHAHSGHEAILHQGSAFLLVELDVVANAIFRYRTGTSSISRPVLHHTARKTQVNGALMNPDDDREKRRGLPVPREAGHVIGQRASWRHERPVRSPAGH